MRINVKRAAIPADSLINRFLPVHYNDTYQCDFVSDKCLTPDDVQVAFWTMQPKVVDLLFKLREILVKPFGLESGKGQDMEGFINCIRTGGVYKTTNIPVKSENETVLCRDDAHLQFFLSVKVDRFENSNQRITATTLVNFKKAFGRIYFTLIYPFHHIIVPVMLKYVVKRLYSKDN